ncbi:MAG TPA: LamG-like jellyroll fold domain-containing protein [Chitinophagaceae bacterium]|nr:LamG-like jellyroll fold domain-containing protein [Chitinophagaceae bacterium]
MKSSIHSFKFIKTTLIWAFLLGVVFVSCSKNGTTPVVVVPSDKTALQASVTVAQDLNDNTLEGTKPNQYEVGTKVALTTALNASKLVLADAKATQAAVNNATAQLIAAIAAYQTHLIKEIAAINLIGYWKMNGNANDSSGNSNNGTLTTGAALYGAGIPTPAADRFGRAGLAYHFDKGGNIDVPYKASLNSPQMSLSLWVKWSSTGRTWDPSTYTMVAMNRWNGYKFQLQGGHLPFYTVKVVKAVGDTTIYDRDDAGTAVAENTWRHLVVTFKTGVMSFYINGDLVKTWDTSTPNPVPGNALTLINPIDFVIGQDLPTNKYLTVDGDYQVAWGGFWTGDMDDVMYYNVALDATQVKSIFLNQNTL